MKATMTLAGLALLISAGLQAAEPLRVAADPVPHAEILNYIKNSIRSST
ncbi:hypothetical protein CSE899_11132 [Cronobacter sakazakii E899]|nr:hypothetical protein CSE899_11132 [Cronobacter sakazakii E899]